MTKALDDILVLDLTTEFWSSLAAAMLGDFGADVVKLEPLPDAHELRDRYRDQNAPETWNYSFELANRNKRSLAIDLDAGRATFEKLVAAADVFLTDLPTAALTELRLDFATLSQLKPDLIYARGSGLGPEGPDSEEPAIDELAAARTGMMPILQQPGQPPVYTGAGQIYTTIMLAFGVTAALHHRDETGEGQEVDASLLGGNMYSASLDIQAFLAMGGERFLQPVSRLDAGNPMSGTLYPTEDGLWVTLTMPDTDRWWPDLSDIVGLDVEDPRYNSHERRCEENRLELISALEEAFAKRPAAHWRDTFNERKMSADVIEDYAYPAQDEQARRNSFIIDVDTENHGKVPSLGFPLYMSESLAELARTAPALGEHTDELLSSLAGASGDEIAALRSKGAVA